jgi:hypothetical protein
VAKCRSQDGLRVAWRTIDKGCQPPTLGICLHDLSNGIKWANRHFAHLLSVDPDKAKVGLHQSEFRPNMHPDDYDRVYTRLGEASRGRRPFNERYRLRDAAGNPRMIIGQGMALENEGRPFFSITLLDLCPDTVASVHTKNDHLDALVALCLSAREMARRGEADVVRQLLDMTLLELGQNIAALQKAPLPNWHQ